jgi:hypothetical protein
MKKLNLILRYFAIALLVFFIIWIGLKRESKFLVFSENGLTFINRYPRTEATNFHSELLNISSFHFSPKLQSSVLFGIAYMISSSLLIGLISMRKSLAKITAFFFIITMFMCFILISLKGIGFDYRLSAGLAHYLEDLILSPFFILVFIVIIKAFKLDKPKES